MDISRRGFIGGSAALVGAAAQGATPYRARGYADKWIGGKRPVTLVGINFNPRKRNIDLPIIEPA